MDGVTTPALKCANSDCTNTCCPTGDGSTPFLATPSGGMYFCCHGCRSAMEPDLDLIACVRQALIDSDHKPGDGPDTLARKLVLGLRPTVLQLPTSNPSMLKFAITQARSASVLTCLLTGDENLEVHTGPDGIQHTPLRIGDFANAISRAEPGAKLHSIANIKFTRVVHLGDTVIITLTRMWERMGFVMYKVEGHVGSEPICEPTEVVVARAK